MKFDTTPAFDGDYRRLKPEHRATFREVVKEKFAPACDKYAADPTTPWPKALRVSMLTGAHGIMEMTWSFASPDGRATFEFIRAEGELICRWRRIGNHAIYREP